MLRHLRSETAAWLGVAAWAVGVFYLSSLSMPAGPSGSPVPQADKIAHFLLYATGGFLLVRALRRSRPKDSAARLFLLATGLLWLYGFGDEFHQLAVPNRTGLSPGDLLADALGTVTGALFYLKLRRGPHPGQRPD